MSLATPYRYRVRVWDADAEVHVMIEPATVRADRAGVLSRIVARKVTVERVLRVPVQVLPVKHPRALRRVRRGPIHAHRKAATTDGQPRSPRTRGAASALDCLIPPGRPRAFAAP